MKIVQLIFTFLALVHSGWAQQAVWTIDNLSSNSNRLMGKLTGTVYYLPSGSGDSYFLQDQWIEGSILLEDDDLFENLQMRYLTIQDELVVYNSGLSQLVILDKERVKRFSFNNSTGDQHFIKLYYDAVVEAGFRYFEIKYSGSRWLLAFHYLSEEKTTLYRDYHGKLKDSRLKPKISYYMYDPGSEKFARIQMKRSSLLARFSEKKREIKQLFRRDGLRKFSEAELIRAFQLLDENEFLDIVEL